MHAASNYMSSVQQYHTCVPYQCMHAISAVLAYTDSLEANLLVCYGYDQLRLLDLYVWLATHTFELKWKPLLSHLSIESLPESEKGSSD